MTNKNEVLDFSNKKPLVPGAYWLKGHIYPTLNRVDLIRVEADEDGQLYACSNLDTNEVDFYIEDASPEFLWSSELVDATKITKALKALIEDLELRAGMKRGDEKDVVDVGQGVYIQAKDALATLNFTEEKS